MKNFRRKDTDFFTSSTLGLKSSASDSSASGLSGAHTIIDDGTDDTKGSLGLNLLYSPSQPRIELIFVHGLGGGSRKTWSKSTSLSHYWPQEWLPRDPAFKDVRIHSFGYNSDYVKGRDNCLNIHHFGKSFLGEMGTSPHLANSDTPIVLIGHSMGGLVIKKAYMLAKQDVLYKSLCERFYSIYFLATPHRGSDSAKTLKNLLQFAFSLRAYVGDLQKGSSTIQVINDGFRQCSTDIDLWSFYETQSLDIGVFSRMIVDPDSAVLGFREEKQMPMNADHRSICKFDAPDDPNYLILRNALSTTINSAIKHTKKSKEDIAKSDLEHLDTYLGISASSLNPEDDLMIAQDSRIAGTCEWLSLKYSFIQWRNFENATRIMWLNGLPASGKSVLAGYIIDQLRNDHHGPSCSYFFFKHADETKSRLGSCLRSLAFQMACADTRIRQIVLGILNGTTLDDDNDRSLWRKLFSSGIFQEQFSKHYWVIDALDECSNLVTFLDSMLAKIYPSLPLRILITSRYTVEIEKLFAGLDSKVFLSERISQADTISDMKRVAETKSKSLTVKNDAHRDALVEQVLLKSQGSFLWTVLVLNELSSSYSEEAISEVLAEVPREMEALYKRILQQMSQSTRSKNLIRAILEWTTCATRPLSVKELEGALHLDIQDTFAKLDETIAALCGQLVIVDKFGRVQMVHETAREFLLSQGLESEFAVEPLQAHTRIAKTCLTYLAGDEMRPPRITRRDSVGDPATWRDAFSGYACDAFSYHISMADPKSMEILVLTERFLKLNVLSWIETVARKQSLTSLIRTSKHLKLYLHKASIKEFPPGKETQLIKCWTTDLIRIAAKFAGALIPLPSSIYSLILPFCPAESMASMTYKSFVRGRKLSLLGFSDTQWDDRLSCINFRQSQPSAICYSDELFAIGLLSGQITLYHAVTCQEYMTLEHGEAVRHLKSKSKTSLLASCGMKLIKVWNVRDGRLLHVLKPMGRPLHLAFDKDVLMAASHKNYLVTWDLSRNATKLPDRPWNDSGEDVTTPFHAQPCAISISIDHGMLAVAYSVRPITLWDIEEDAFYGSCGKKLPNGETSTYLVTALIFNPNKTIGLLVASYLDGELVLMDPFSDEEVKKTRANCHTLAASPDGRFLGGGAGGGVIDIFEFETLRLIYRVKSSDFFVKQIAFSKESLSFADIRGKQCNIWDSTALLRETVGDDGSDGTASSLVEAFTSDTSVRISSLTIDPEEEVIFCGKDDGSVSTYDLKSGKQQRILYHHKSLVRTIEWSPRSSMIASVDISNGILGWQVKKSVADGWTTGGKILQSRLNHGSAIVQVLTSPAGDKLLLSTRENDHLWIISANQSETRQLSGSQCPRKWLQHPYSHTLLIRIDSLTAKVYSWSELSEISSITFDINLTGMQLKHIIPQAFQRTYYILLELSEKNGTTETRRVYLFDVLAFDISTAGSSTATSAALQDDLKSLSISEENDKAVTKFEPLFDTLLQILSNFISHIIGFNNAGRLVFLDKQSWVCSVEVENMASYSRHFFVPYDWFAGIQNIICGVGKDVIFARNNDVVIAKGGLEFSERVDIEVDDPPNDLRV
ncbi:WD40 repeat-like protein [Annulohypoxylon moriforme]|nr:WD40 repeat-like protein [Annulohypoxylon moriforme]